MADDREEQIRNRAHAIWESEGQPEGRDKEHWAQAEGEHGGGDAETQAEAAPPEPAATPEPEATPVAPVTPAATPAKAVKA